MRRLTLALSLSAAAFGLLATIVAQDAKPATPTLTARKVAKAPEFTADVELWKGVPSIEVATHYEGTKAGPVVELRAQHDGTQIFLMARWKDETKSTTKGALEFRDGVWLGQTGDEDRIAIAINGNVPEFAEKGCATLCHTDEAGKAAMSISAEKLHADLWHWKAARGGLDGYADDQNFNVNQRGDDAGKSAYEANANADKTGPKWVWKTDAGKQGAFSADTTMETPADFKPENGYTVPSNRFRKPAASRGDVEAAAEHKDGWWTVVFKRKLDTGNADDTKLTAGEVANIALAVLDNRGVKTGKEHAKSVPIKLSVEK